MNSSLEDSLISDKNPIWHLQATSRINQFILDNPLILYHNDPEKSADVSPDMSSDTLAIIDLVPKKRKNINNCNRPVKKIKYKLYD